MPVDVIQVQYEQLANVAGQFGRTAESVAATQRSVLHSAQQLRQGGWQGRGSAAFQAEMDGVVFPTLQRLSAALHEAQRVTQQISAVVRRAEEEAAHPFRGLGWQVSAPESSDGVTPSAAAGGTSGQGSPSPSQSAPGVLRPLIDVAKSIFNAADQIGDMLPIPASILLALGLSPGAKYAGQVVVRAPQWLADLGINGRWLRNAAGVSEHLTHIKAGNMAVHIGKGAKALGAVGALIVAGRGVTAVADVWERRSGEYASYSTSRRVSAMAVDAALSVFPLATEVGGGLVGVKVGATAGAAIMGTLGSVIPVAGTAVGVAAGAVIGGALGGFAGDWLGAKIGEGVTGMIQQAGWREPMIDFIDGALAQPVASGINGATTVLRSVAGQLRPPPLRFGW